MLRMALEKEPYCGELLNSCHSSRILTVCPKTKVGIDTNASAEADPFTKVRLLIFPDIMNNSNAELS